MMLWEKLSTVCEVNCVNEANVQSTITESNKSDEEYDEEENMLNDFLNQIFNVNTEGITDIKSKIENLILNYSNSSTDVLDFWKSKKKKNSDPELYALSNVCFAIPPTQVCIFNCYCC